MIVLREAGVIVCAGAAAFIPPQWIFLLLGEVVGVIVPRAAEVIVCAGAAAFIPQWIFLLSGEVLSVLVPRAAEVTVCTGAAAFMPLWYGPAPGMKFTQAKKRREILRVNHKSFPLFLLPADSVESHDQSG